MISLAGSAADAQSGEDSRHKASAEYHKLVTDFRQIVTDATVGSPSDYSTETDNQALNVQSIKDILLKFGLDSEKSESIAQVVNEFVYPTSDQMLASEAEKGKRPLNLPLSGTNTSYSDPAAMLDGDITTRADAIRAVTDLKSLQDQIKKNLTALDDVRTVIGQNVTLVRAAGLSMITVASQIKNETDADKIAVMVADEIRRNAPAALAQTENLHGILVAGMGLLGSA